MNKSIIIEEQYPYSPDEVWEALTDQSQLDEWLMHGTFQPRVGAEFELYWSGNDSSKGMTRGKVMEMVRPHKLSYSWDWGADSTLVTFFLEPNASGTKLRLEHTGFVEGKDENVYQGTVSGWMGKLKTSLPASISKRQNAMAK
ncbi:MAG: SRPBCC domain-containing protein [Bacteroidota bacterium]|nr:SRPBCC domain-containing protein [Bacteroidota bacterium]MDP4232521.1 SRPBCC domain-containing protein [Bacteroidota bacterium]MDP4241656.1 SRPBCC domain-containing protein [Bacteroidota bacterium]MDP4286401.1 SRPBCC domain-containing protein [Bacteroidota bacterium]